MIVSSSGGEEEEEKVVTPSGYIVVLCMVEQLAVASLLRTVLMLSSGAMLVSVTTGHCNWSHLCVYSMSPFSPLCTCSPCCMDVTSIQLYFKQLVFLLSLAQLFQNCMRSTEHMKGCLQK